MTMHTCTPSHSHPAVYEPAEGDSLACEASPGSATAGPLAEFISPLLLQSLARPSAYPNDASAALGVEHIQTHISHVFLTEERVYKLRKSVDLGFVDFSTRSERNADCLREVWLNRRLAPDVYLGVAPLERDLEGFAVGGLVGANVTVLPDSAEHCVVMRRLPAGRDALSLLSAGQLTARHIGAVAERIAELHLRNRLSSKCPENALAILKRVKRPFQDCLRMLEALSLGPEIDTTLHAIDILAGRFLSAHEEKICERARRGLWVEGHGDLHLQHVWFDHDADQPLIIDCLEFDQELRQIDPASDVAFLAMDLVYRGRDALAELLLGRYANATDDFDLFWVVDYFQSYRAAVRAKVAAIASADPVLEKIQRQAAERSALRHLTLAERCLRKPASGSLVVLCGKVGTGKSTVAEFLAGECDAIVVSSDRLRKKLAGLPGEARVSEPIDTGLYAPQRTAAVYEGMLERAVPVVASGRLALLDATFSTQARRDRARAWAKEHHVPVLLVEVECATDTALERLAKRRTAAGSLSDAGPEFYATSAARYEPPDEWPRETRLALRTDASGWRVDALRKLRTWRSRDLRRLEKSERRMRRDWRVASGNRPW